MSEQHKSSMSRRQFGEVCGLTLAGLAGGFLVQGCSDSSSKGYVPPSGGGNPPTQITAWAAIDASSHVVVYYQHPSLGLQIVEVNGVVDDYHVDHLGVFQDGGVETHLVTQGDTLILIPLTTGGGSVTIIA